jgi:ribosomal protein L16 Arg81 hydroxylase
LLEGKSSVSSTAILYPVTVEEFKKKYYRKKALVIKIGDSSRYEDLIKEHFYNLELVN